MTFRTLGAIALLATTLACNGEEASPTAAPTDRTDAVLALTGNTADGANNYANSCAGCHAADGTGTASGPDLTARVPNASETSIVSILINGEDSMPSFASQTDQELADLTAYLIQEWGN